VYLPFWESLVSLYLKAESENNHTVGGERMWMKVLKLEPEWGMGNLVCPNSRF